MVILELRIDPRPDNETVRFVAADHHAEGFTLEMPAHEWRALDYPDTVQFVVSRERLGVRAGWIERIDP